ncbi:MAG: response regulator [Steroidobacteraceae bacterium]
MPGNDEQFARILLDAINGGLVVLGADERILKWNTWMHTASGYSESQVRGKSLTEIFPDANLKRVTYAITAALEANASTIITHALSPSLLPLRTRSDRELLHDITVSPLAGGPDKKCLIFFTDVTMATRRERYLRERQNARYDAVVESAPDVILTVDDEGIIQLANPAALSQFGYSSGELVGTSATALFETKEEWTATWKSAINTGLSPRHRDLIAKRRNGSLSYLEASASRWTSAARVFVTVIFRDVNERRVADVALRESEEEARDIAAALEELNENLEQRVQDRTAQLMKAEEALRQSQKMESIGNLTGGIAHDFNNLLQVISGNLALLRRDVAGNVPAEQRVRNAADAVKRSAKLSSQLLAFARRQTLDPKVINLGRFIHDMGDILRKAVGEGVTIEAVIAPGVWNTLIDPGNVENALLNLAINARDAMHGQGTLTIEASNTFLDSDYVRANKDAIRGEYVLVSITDTGTGMAPEVIEQAFEPFFTTKAEGKGTGLGLSMVYGFVKQSGGHIKLLSEVGHGTTIKLYLPRSTQVEDRLVNLDSMPVEGGTEMVLVAEDDEYVRESVVAMFSDLGYRVIKAKDAQSALVIIESGMPVDLLFTDVIMPGTLRSADLAYKARERIPGLAVLFTSGYTENAVSTAGRLDPNIELLPKPYTREALARKVRHVLGNAVQRQTGRALRTPAAIAAARPATKQKRQILVCEDDAVICESLVEMLRSMGHDTHSAANGRAALSILALLSPDILLTDVGLPDMSGMTLAAQALAQVPQLSVIFASGAAVDPGAPGYRSAGTLIKPFTFDALCAAVAAAGP